MGWLPEEPSDAFWFALAPVTAVPTLVYSAAGAFSGDYPYGKPDWKANIRNTGIWGAIAVGAHAINSYFHPGKYSFLTGTSAFKTAAHLTVNPITIAAAVTTATAIGWAATGDVHGAVPPGTGMGMPMTPGLYSQGTSSNPAGWDFGSWWDNLF